MVCVYQSTSVLNCCGTLVLLCLYVISVDVFKLGDDMGVPSMLLTVMVSMCSGFVVNWEMVGPEWLAAIMAPLVTMGNMCIVLVSGGEAAVGGVPGNAIGWLEGGANDTECIVMGDATIWCRGVWALCRGVEVPVCAPPTL